MDLRQRSPWKFYNHGSFSTDERSMPIVQAAKLRDGIKTRINDNNEAMCHLFKK